MDNDKKFILLESVVVPLDHPEERLDRIASTMVTALPSRKSAAKAAKRGELLLDGLAAAPDVPVKGGQIIALLRCQSRPRRFPLKLDVLWEDEWMAVVIKPPGFPVNGNQYRTVENALAGNLQPTSLPDGLAWPRPAHRLDAQTGGILLVAKNSRSATSLSEQFESRSIVKFYRAIVAGRVDQSGTINVSVNGKDAESYFQTLSRSRSLHTQWVTELELTARTGRTHQLRIHMAAIGHPIAGDRLYGTTGNIYRGKGLFLWASKISFNHPHTGARMDFDAEPPRKFAAYLLREERRWQRYNTPG